MHSQTVVQQNKTVTSRDAIHANRYTVACSWWRAGYNLTFYLHPSMCLHWKRNCRKWDE